MKQFKNILYVSERAVNQDTAIARAVSLAKNNQAQLTVIDVVPDHTAGIMMPPEGPIAIDLMEALKAQRRQELENLIAPHQSQLQPAVDILVGTTFLEVIRAVLKQDFDLVIKPSENPDWIDRLFGSDDMHLLRKCPCPVWLTKPEETNNYDQILAAIDFNPNNPDPDDAKLNEAILSLASSLALSDFAKLHIVHAWDASEAGFASLWSEKPERVEMQIREGKRSQHKAALDKLTRKLRDQIGDETYDYISVSKHLPMGSARKTVPALAKEISADLVVMGTVARTGIPGFIIGNTAESILDQLNCSVLALKPTGFVSPVTLV